MNLREIVEKYLADGNVCVLEPVYRVGGAGNAAEVKIAADMVILDGEIQEIL